MSKYIVYKDSDVNSLPIGVFDSGLGGLTVLKAITALMPNENTTYLGDTARVPYGSKSEKTVTRFSLENANFLIGKGIKLLVVACNTASAYSLKALQEHCDIPVVGVIKSGALSAAKVSKTKNIGVIGTEGTVKSGAYTKTILDLLPRARVFEHACPLLVPLVEEGWLDNDITRQVIETYVQNFKGDSGEGYRVDTLVLGCTHYPLLKKTFEVVLGESVQLIDSAIETASTVKSVLEYMNLSNDKMPGKRFHQFFVSDLNERFKMVGRLMMGKELEPISEVDVS